MIQRSIGKNVIYNLIKTMGTYLFPLITYPIIYRILGVEEIGKYSYSYSIITYFILIAGMGIETYAIREGAKIREDNKKFDIFASQMVGCQFISTILSYTILFAFLICAVFLKNYRHLIFILSPIIGASAFSFNWVVNVYEDFLYVTIRTFIINVFSFFCIILFVRRENDIYVYAAIQSIQFIVIMLINIFYLKKYFILRLSFNIIEHIKPIVIIFCITLATQIYVNLDTTMLGYISGDRFVGLYNVASKVYSVAKTAIITIVTTYIPRLTSFTESSSINYNQKLFSKNLNILLKLIILISFPLAAGIYLFSQIIIILFSGQAYLEAAVALRILAIAIPICCLSTCINSCVLIIFGEEKKVFVVTFIGAVVNFALNFYFIPKFLQNGAAFTTLVAEGLVLILDIYYVRKYIYYFSRKNIFDSIIKGMSGILIVWLTYFIASKVISSIFFLLTTVIISSVLIYFSLLILVRDDLACLFLKIMKGQIKKI